LAPGHPAESLSQSVLSLGDKEVPIAPAESVVDVLKHEHASIDAWCRQDDTVIYNTAATFLPLTFGALAFALQWPKLRLPLAFFSLSLYTYRLAMSVRLSWFSAARLRRAVEVEKLLGISHDRYVSNRPAETTRRIAWRSSVR